MDARKKTAERIKAARSIAGYAERKAFCSRFNFPVATLEAWERGKNPLTLKGAKRLVQILREVGVYSSEEWLREGKGISPRPIEEISESFDVSAGESLHAVGENLKIAKEISTFITQNEGAIVTIVNDDAMLPFYEEGDYVGGVKHRGCDIKEVINKRCIIEFPNRKLTVRQLSKGIDSSHYNISAINLNTKMSPTVEYNVEIISAAPILWHRSYGK